ncbi:MAG: sodium/substrate symporter small subunit [Methyloceanibacter sp.]
MATEISTTTDRAGRDRHQLRTLVLACVILLAALLAVVLAVFNAVWLNQYWFLHFPLGYYLLAQGVLIFIVAVTFWFIRAQEHIDRTRSESEELE